MAFSIEIEDTIRDESTGPWVRGHIVMGDFEESFESPTHFWSPDDYRQHWKEALERIEAGMDSGLLTTAYEKNDQWAGFMWTLYFRGGHILIHQMMILPGVNVQSFTPNNPFAEIPEYYREGEDGPVSEWDVPTAEIVTFLKTGMV